MRLNEIIGLFLAEKPIPRISRSEFYSEEHYALYYLTYKIDYHRRLLAKFRRHQPQHNDTELQENYQEILMHLKTSIVDYEGQLIALFNAFGTNNRVGDLQHIYRTAVELPDLPPEIPEDIVLEDSDITENTAAIKVNSSNIDHVWAAMESQEIELERNAKQPPPERDVDLTADTPFLEFTSSNIQDIFDMMEAEKQKMTS